MARPRTETELDPFDRAILRELTENGRATQAELGARARLSGTAAARRHKLLEERGLITGYHADLDRVQLGYPTTVVVRIQLESQKAEAFEAFETAVQSCPSVAQCYLLSGGEDYILVLYARDLADFERIHREELSELPGVSRMQSHFAIREAVRRPVPPALLAPRR
jgi:Lrp/AsnC family leucine-responsive transcriptional regulator